jgi:hypothetical protein
MYTGVIRGTGVPEWDRAVYFYLPTYLFGSNYLDVLSFGSFTSKDQSSFRNTWNDQSAFVHAKIMASVELPPSFRT